MLTVTKTANFRAQKVFKANWLPLETNNWFCLETNTRGQFSRCLLLIQGSAWGNFSRHESHAEVTFCVYSLPLKAQLTNHYCYFLSGNPHHWELRAWPSVTHRPVHGTSLAWENLCDLSCLMRLDWSWKCHTRLSRVQLWKEDRRARDMESEELTGEAAV